MAGSKLDSEAFAPFREFLEACQDYAELSGCRFLMRDFRDEAMGRQSSAMQAAAQKAADVVKTFSQRLLSEEEALRDCVERAHRFVMTESVRAGIVATCREVGLWPPAPRPTDVAEDDCAYQDTTSPLPVIAQRAYNDEACRQRDQLLQPLVRRATTASFIVDFATEVGFPPPKLNDQHHEMLEEFMSRVEEWMAGRASGHNALTGSSASELARSALLKGLSHGGMAAESARQQVKTRWSKNWETPAGTVLNVAAAGLAIVAGFAAMKRASKPR
eukprot:gb/GFBE01021137.1/.p1 GENE.gb/GFBE01021137.1/~~gb/GFBE01021137.1/.p1  ORF type:complete len:274 (+),score=53.66 gb/GFBE01021137.1/:1-822(+)